MSNYPEPVREQLRGDIEEYVRYVVDEAWPQQQNGEVPIGGIKRADAIQDRLAEFEPVKEGDTFRALQTTFLR